MKIKDSEIKITVRNILLGIFSFYLVFPLREVINKFFNVADTLLGQFIIGVIGLILIIYIFNIE